MPQPLIDRAELERQTFGDLDLMEEVAAMFVEQTPMLLAALAASAGTARGEIAHRLKGSAAALGAGPMTAAAGAVEERPEDAAALAELERIAAGTLAAFGEIAGRTR